MICPELRVHQPGLDTADIEDVIWGNVTQVAEQGGCLARSAVLMSDFDEAEREVMAEAAEYHARLQAAAQKAATEETAEEEAATAADLWPVSPSSLS